jgi:urease accessory protein
MKLRTVPFLLVLPSIAFAHQTNGETGRWIDGLLHPLLGPDHLLAALALGLWAGAMAGRKAWLLPLSFSLALLAGAALGPLLASFPVAELAIALSVLVLGLLAVARSMPGLPLALGAASLIGLLHGHAHGVEGLGSTGQAGYALGLTASTWGLHALGLLAAHRLPRLAVRLLGGSIALAGAGMML